MKNDFQILDELLIGPVSEVAGRSAAPVSEVLKEKLDKFVQGKLTAEQRMELCAEILREEPAIELLAGMIKKTKSPETEG
jgi:hypothetical protein